MAESMGRCGTRWIAKTRLQDGKNEMRKVCRPATCDEACAEHGRPLANATICALNTHRNQ